MASFPRKPTKKQTTTEISGNSKALGVQSSQLKSWRNLFFCFLKSDEGKYMGVSENSGFSTQIIHFNRVFHYKPSMLGYPYFWKHPYTTGKKGGISMKYTSIRRIYHLGARSTNHFSTKPTWHPQYSATSAKTKGGNNTPPKPNKRRTYTPDN